MNRKAFAILGLTVVAGCDAWLTKPSLYSSVEVIAARRNGEPIPALDLVLYTGPRSMGYGTTGPDGRFTFRQVPQGIYGVAATPPDGYDVIENFIRGPSSIVFDKLDVAGDTLAPVRITLLKRGPGTIVARVVQTDGTPIVGATVEAFEPGKTNARAVTDASGTAVFPSVPFGVHGVLVTRPPPYRDFRTPGDSMFAVHQDLIVEEGIRDSVVFVLAKCTGTLRALVQDDAGAPISGANVVFYTFGAQLATRPTGPDGRVAYAEAPCAVQLGVTIGVPPGYALSQGPGSSFFDGLTLTSGAARDVTFRLRKLR